MKNPLFALALLSLTAVAQTRPQGAPREGRERLESAKIAYITRELDLTPSEAQAFWPVYNAMEAEMKKAQRDPIRESMKTMKAEGGIDNLTDAQAREVLANLEKVAAEREAVRRKYQKEFLKVLPAKKVLKLHLAERKFKQEVLERLKEGRPPREGARPPGGRPPGGRPPQFEE
jgi:Spy/CpxP family protein refolding chaperone